MIDRTDNERQRYLPALDGLRAVAIMSIICYQLVPYRLPGGFLGIDLFIILSGYLMTNSMMNSLMISGKVPLKSFLKKRLWKMMKPLFAMCVSVVIYITIFQRDLLQNLRPRFLSSIFFVNNWWQIANGQSYFEQLFNHSPFSHLWYLSMSFQFYLIWPFLFVFLSTFIRHDKTLKKVILAISGVSILWMAILFKPLTDASRIFYGTDTRLFTLLFGALLALQWPLSRFDEPIALGKKKKQFYIGLIAFSICTFALLFFNSQSTWMYRGGYALFDLSVCILVLAGLQSRSIISIIFRLKPMTWIGRRSYSYYLWYFPIIVLYQAKYIDLSGQPWGHLGIQIVLILLLGEIWYQLFERRNLLWNKQWLSKKNLHDMLANLQTNPVAQLPTLLFILVSMVFVSIFFIGFLKTDDQMNANEIQVNQMLETHKVLAEKTKQTDRESIRTINHVEGLTREETVFSNTVSTTFIGDSVLLASMNELGKIFPTAVVDASIGRQLYQSTNVVLALKQQNLIKETVVVVLGTNGAFSLSQAEHLAKTIGMEKQIFFVNTNVPRLWKNQVNQTLQELDEKYANIHMIDWNAHLQEHQQDWLYSDSIHPNEEGSKQFALFVTKQIYANLKKE